MSSVFSRIQQQIRWTPPKDYLRIQTIDMHTGGEPLRVILSGFPELSGSRVLDYRNDIRQRADHLRRALMHEPRGHADMYGCLLLPPDDDQADFGVLFLHNAGYSTMCGHAIIALGKLALEMGWVEKKEGDNQVVIDAPCGRITTFVEVRQGIVQQVRFHGVPSFVVALDQEVEVEGLGMLRYDLAYGGAFYAYVDVHQIGYALLPQHYQQLIHWGMAIKKAVMASSSLIQHPFESDLSFLYGTIFIGGPVSEGVDSRNVCIFADGEVDRCPTGSGVSGRLPIHFERGELQLGEHMTVESITGSVFKGKIIDTLKYGPYTAVIPEVTGMAYITGQHEFFIDPDDPFAEGFFLR